MPVSVVMAAVTVMGPVMVKTHIPSSEVKVAPLPKQALVWLTVLALL